MTVSEEATSEGSFYEAVGGWDTFVRLVDDFYDGVAGDVVLRGMYPAELGPARERMTAFLAQYWGGPRRYSGLRGHPRLRMRHAAFRMDADTRERWLRHMRTALDGLDLDPRHEQQLWTYLERAAHSLAPDAG
ncbi:globin domain-containing protein (plasmid) [Pseudonocardia bannensis]|uniref:globin domain-containing protein n=1 Tax=Pseudonocardia bannensis TaxID=630973 RepID=UPI0028ABBFC7|nr:globin [Pseudonocardia bannensis]